MEAHLACKAHSSAGAFKCRHWATESKHGLVPPDGRFGPGGWAVPSVLGERQGQSGLEGGFLIDVVVLEDRKWRWTGELKGPDMRVQLC